jgi:hypothetical protein
VVRALIALALSLFLCFSPYSAATARQPTRSENRTAVRIERLALAAVAGAGIGAIAAVAAGNAAAGATLGTFSGTLAALYVAHLFVEAIVVGGVYYFWPWERPKKSGAPSGRAIRSALPPPATLGLRLATRR